MPATPVLKVSPSYIAWTLATNRAIMGHLYQFQSALGVYDYFTDLDFDVNVLSQTWKSGSLRFSGLQRKIGVGTDIDEQNLRIWASPTDTLFGANFLKGAEQGLLDGAIITRNRIIWEFVTGNAAYDAANGSPLALFTLFTGYTSSIAKGGTSHIDLKVKSALLRLNINMPRNYWQPGCLWTLYDSGCTLNQASFAVTGTVGVSGISSKVIPISGGVSPEVGADGLLQYAQGRLFFTSGVNNNLQCLIDSNDSSNLYLAYPLNELPSPGDTVTYYPGCSKSFNTCNLKYSNSANFRGFDKVPPIMVSI